MELFPYLKTDADCAQNIERIKERENMSGSMSLAQNPYLKKGSYQKDFSLQN